MEKYTQSNLASTSVPSVQPPSTLGRQFLLDLIYPPNISFCQKKKEHKLYAHTHLSLSILLRFFWWGPFLKSLLNLLQYCLFYALVFWPRGMWDLNSLTRDWTQIPCVGRWSVNHWTTREVPSLFLYFLFFLIKREHITIFFNLAVHSREVYIIKISKGLKYTHYYI